MGGRGRAGREKLNEHVNTQAGRLNRATYSLCAICCQSVVGQECDSSLALALRSLTGHRQANKKSLTERQRMNVAVAFDWKKAANTEMALDALI